MSRARAVRQVVAVAVLFGLAADSACADDSSIVQTLAWRRTAGENRALVHPVGQFGFGYRRGWGSPYSGGLYSLDSDFGFYRPYSYGYSFYRPYSGFYYRPYSSTSLYRPFYYPYGFYRPRASFSYYGGPGISAFYGSGAFVPHYGYGACGAYGYGAYGYGAGPFGY